MTHGTGRVGGRCTLENAYANLQALLDAAGLSSVRWRRDVEAVEDDGRFAFLVPIAGVDVSVLVPGCAFDVLTNESLISAPRFYIDGNSWWWRFAIETVRSRAARTSGRELAR